MSTRARGVQTIRRFDFSISLHKLKIENLFSTQVNGEVIDVGSVESIAVNNISSWGAGADPWGAEPDPRFQSQKYDDGLLEVIGFTGVYHMGKIKSGLSTGIRLAQGSFIDITLKVNVNLSVSICLHLSSFVFIRLNLSLAIFLRLSPSFSVFHQHSSL